MHEEETIGETDETVRAKAGKVDEDEPSNEPPTSLKDAFDNWGVAFVSTGQQQDRA